MILIIVLIIVLFALIIQCNKNNDVEKFTLFTANPNHLIDSECMDSAPRHVRFSRNGGIVYVSNRPPTEAKCNKVECPRYIDKSVTLGNNNNCWMC